MWALASFVLTAAFLASACPQSTFGTMLVTFGPLKLELQVRGKPPSSRIIYAFNLKVPRGVADRGSGAYVDTNYYADRLVAALGAVVPN